MAILITPSIINRAAAKFAIKEEVAIGDAAGAPGEEAHIYNLYEELGMPLSDIIEIGRLGLEGKLENVQEKMDGQFLAFTVTGGQLKFFTKMDLQGQGAKDKKLSSIRAGGKGGGMTLSEIMSTYTGDRSNIAEGFAIAYEALEPIALPYQDLLFRDGEVVIASQIMVSRNPNTILYNQDSLRTVLAISLTAEPVDEQVLKSFKLEMAQASTDAFTMDEVPTAKLVRGLEKDDAEIQNLEKDLEQVVGEVGLSIGKNTVGDYIVARLEKIIKNLHSEISDEQALIISRKFAQNKSALAVLPKGSQRDLFRKTNGMQKIYLQEAIIPLEEIVQRLGLMIIDKLDLALTASNHQDLLEFINYARESFKADRILGDEKTLEGIRVALGRIEANQNLFKKATEGIVFTYNNKTYKLTGLFTPINKLRGFFKRSMGREGFGKAELPEKDTLLERIVERISMISEGGNAFSRTEGGKRVPVTNQDRIPRSEVSKIVDSFQKEILDQIGLTGVPVGTTGTETSTVGDIDLCVPVRRIEDLVQMLSSIPELQEDLPEVPGIARIKRLPRIVAVLYQAPDSSRLLQVDVIPANDDSCEDMAWMMAGSKDDGSIKGRYKNILLGHVAKELGKKQSTPEKDIKITYADGVLIKIDGIPDERGRVTDPDDFLPMLGISLEKDRITSFEDLVDYMRSDMWLNTILPSFRGYIDNRQHLQSKDEIRKREAEMAIEYINNETLEESVRKAIRKILKEDSQEQLFTPAHMQPGESISIPWLKQNSIDDPLYDMSSYTLKEEGIPSLINGFINSDARVEGEMLEDGLTAYAESIGAGKAEVLRGEGEDLKVGNRTYELKKSKKNTPNLMLNASFPKSRENHYYMFLTNMPTVSQVRNAMGSEDISISDINLDQEDAPEEEDNQTSLIDAINEESEISIAASALSAVPLFSKVKVYIVPSVTLRLYILQSAFPGGGKQGENQMYNPRTGEFTAGGTQAMIENVKDKLDQIGIEYKIAEKIAPTLTRQIRDGLPPGTVKDGFDIKIGLLKIRIRLGIEPRTTVNDIKKIYEQVDFVASYATDCDDWVTIKKQVMLGLAPSLRKNFSTRDPKTKEQALNNFEKELINYYRDKTGIDLVLRTLDERRGLFDVL